MFAMALDAATCTPALYAHAIESVAGATLYLHLQGNIEEGPFPDLSDLCNCVIHLYNERGCRI